jgi:Fe-S cluster assembly protein SufD
MSALLDSLLAPFETLAARDAGGLGAGRRDALASARDEGLPAARSEAWKYTSLRALERRAFAPSLALPHIDPATLDLPAAPRLVFVNGLFAPALSATDALPHGVSFAPLSLELARGDERELAFLARRYAGRGEIFARVNAALSIEGMVLRVEEGVEAKTPIHLVLIGASDSDRAWHLRHLVELRRDAALTLVEHRIGSGAHAHLANEVAQIHLARGASLTHARVQDDANASTLLLRTDAVLAADATYRRLDLELGAALSRHELNVALQGAGAKLHANGVLLAGGRRHVDTRLGIDHVAPDTHSELIWRGLGADRGRAVFHGGITIREGADGSEAMLANKNLLLSEGAEIDTQPVLEIHADEVKAAHGATVGRLDANALFYLRSRGLPENEARALLTAAFCRETLALLDDSALVATLAERLDAALATLGVGA